MCEVPGLYDGLGHENLYATVDGRNPAPPGMYETL